MSCRGVPGGVRRCMSGLTDPLPPDDDEDEAGSGESDADKIGQRPGKDCEHDCSQCQCRDEDGHHNANLRHPQHRQSGRHRQVPFVYEPGESQNSTWYFATLRHFPEFIATPAV